MMTLLLKIVLGFVAFFLLLTVGGGAFGPIEVMIVAVLVLAAVVLLPRLMRQRVGQG